MTWSEERKESAQRLKRRDGSDATRHLEKKVVRQIAAPLPSETANETSENGTHSVSSFGLKWRVCGSVSSWLSDTSLFAKCK